MTMETECKDCATIKTCKIVGNNGNSKFQCKECAEIEKIVESNVNMLEECDIETGQEMAEIYDSMFS